MSQAVYSDPPVPNRLPRMLYLAGGCFFTGMAILGAVLPLLPATPFLLLASGCFARSSPRMHRWLLWSPLLGPILRDWRQRRGVTRKVKITAMLVVVAGVSATLFGADLPAGARVAAACLGGIGLTVVARLPLVR